MDRLPDQLDRLGESLSLSNDSVVGFGPGEERLVEESSRHLQIDQQLFSLPELDVLYQEGNAALWTFMRPRGRPSFTPSMLRDFEDWQRLILENFGSGQVPLRYLILGSRAQGVFCFGGDLELFERLIRNGDRKGLVRYGYRCVEILHRNMNALDMPMLTIGLAQGAALGGGLEALLSFDHIIAERSATFGLPEILFGLFPGMGAHAILSRKLGAAMAERLILSSHTYTAGEMYEMGLVHQIAEDGEGVRACEEFIQKSQRRHPGLVSARKAMRVASPIDLPELKRIVDLWADAALQLTDTDLKFMGRLTRAQHRLGEAA